MQCFCWLCACHLSLPQSCAALVAAATLQFDPVLLDITIFCLLKFVPSFIASCSHTPVSLQWRQHAGLCGQAAG